VHAAVRDLVHDLLVALPLPRHTEGVDRVEPTRAIAAIAGYRDNTCLSTASVVHQE
jgi:hypothetical protein